MTTQLITESFGGKPIPFHSDDAFVNATIMCAAFGRLPNEFLRLTSTQAFIAALTEENPMRENPVLTQHGGASPGTWIHPDLALECARWLSPAFSLWCGRIIRRILSGEMVVKPVQELTKLQILEMAIESEKQVQSLTRENAQLAPKAATFDLAMQSDHLLDMNTACKLVCGGHRNNLMAKLREKKVLLLDNTPAQAYHGKGYFEVKETPWENPKTHKVHVAVKTMVTQKGLNYLRRCAAKLAEEETESALLLISALPSLPAFPPRSLVAALKSALAEKD